MHLLVTVNAAWNVWHFRKGLIAALRADGHRITVLAPPDASLDRLAGMGCAFHPLRMNLKGINPLADLALERRFRRILRRTAPDAVLGFTIKNNIYGARAATACGIPFLPNVTGLGTAFLSGGMLQRIAEGLYRRAFAPLDTVFFQNPEDRDLFVERRLVRAEQARVLPGSGIDLAAFAPAPLPEDPPVFLMIARLLRDKGVGEFVEAARILRRRRPELRFRLVGDVAENRSAIDAATLADWCARDDVEFAGPCADVRPEIAAAHCVVLPSYREGAPRTLIEAAAMGRPVIASDVPGCRTVVARDVTGLLCAPRDAGSLADALQRFLDLAPGARAAMGAAGRARMEREYDETHIVTAYRAALARIARPGAA